MRKLVFTVLTCITFTSSGFASDAINLNSFITDLFEEYFGLCKFEVASLDDEGNVLEYLTEEKKTDGRKPCLAWANERLTALEEQGYCLGQEDVKYWAQ